MPSPESLPAARHWRRTRRLGWSLLAIWVLVSFVAPYFARDLDQQFFGWPFGFWMAAQGGLLVYLGLVVAYDHRMRRLDTELLDEERRG